MATKKKKSEQTTASLIITVLAVLLAICAVIFLVITTTSDESGNNNPNKSQTTEFEASEELINAAQQVAYDLLPKNYKAFQYFTRGMKHDEEPYGNLPEDGFYTCTNDDFPDFATFSEFINSIYVQQTAEKLLTNPFGNGPLYGVDDTGALGLSSNLVPSEEEDLSWNDARFICLPVSETECKVNVVLKDSLGNEVEKETTMALENGQWKLSEMIG